MRDALTDVDNSAIATLFPISLIDAVTDVAYISYIGNGATLMKDELTTICINEVPSANCVADWQEAARHDAARRAAIAAEADFDWSGFSL